MLQIEIDGKKIETKPGRMIIEIADELGIDIPRFCYHKKLSIAANCRMCLVDVEKAPKPLPACATPVANGMKIWTTSMRARIAQKSVMEFLLINHPLDCPICDQGGECELQDLAMGYGGNLSRFCEGKRVVKDKNISPLISTDMTRCIHCTRCVRFGEEVAGIREMGAAGRGEETKIGTFIEKNIESEVSGNIIDLCPVGALTSKPFRYKARAWELKEFECISSHDSLGSNLLVHTYNNKVVRVVPKENVKINENWLSDRDRFAYEGIYNNRLLYPAIKINDEWHNVSWDEAIKFSIELVKKNLEKYSSDSICGLISGNSTNEELFLFQKIIRHLGSNNIDHRTKQVDFANQDSYPVHPNIGCQIEDIENFESVLLVGSDIHKESPLLALRLRSLSLKKNDVFIINPLHCNVNFDVTKNVVPKKGNILSYLSSILKSCAEIKKYDLPAEIKNMLSKTKSSVQHKSIAKKICETKSHIVIGIMSQLRKDSSQVVSICNLISIISGASVGTINFDANSAGAWLLGCVPHRKYNGYNLPKEECGNHFINMLSKKNNLWLLHNIEPQDCSQQNSFKNNLKNSNVINISSFDSKLARELSNVMLPISTNYEIQGSFFNCEGILQSFKSPLLQLKKAKYGWKVLRTFANYLKMDGFKYSKIDDINNEINSLIKHDKEDNKFKMHFPHSLKQDDVNINIINNIYNTDNIVRRASSLQKTSDAKNKNYLFISEDYAAKHNIKDLDLVQVKNKKGLFKLPVIVNSKMEKNSIMAYLGTEIASHVEEFDNDIILEGIN
jgi:NADH-quinone oxidoreductase subunit G